MLEPGGLKAGVGQHWSSERMYSPLPIIPALPHKGETVTSHTPAADISVPRTVTFLSRAVRLLMFRVGG
jgi:hypothetical protein